MQCIEATLPVDAGDGFHLDIEEARQRGHALSETYARATPFPHIVIDGFLPPAILERLIAEFPVAATARERLYDRGYRGHHKRQIDPNECSGYIRSLFAFLNSAPVLQFLEQLSGIGGLIADPYFNGGGLHETGAGGLLGVHTDFRINKTLHLQRRLNLILYLNQDWKPDYGGDLELWDRDMQVCLTRVAPVFNRCVVFNTDEHSNHGHPEPLTPPPGMARRSLALYYYTASKAIYDEIEAHRTAYKPRPGDGGQLKGWWRRLCGGK